MNQSKPHRKTLKRYDLPNHIHELTFSCYKRLPLLVSERTNLYLSKSVITACEKLDYSVIAYVFMPTHVHILVRPNRYSYSISDFLRLVKQPVARMEISYLKRYEPEKLVLLSTEKKPKYLFWLRGGGFDRNVTDIDCLNHSMNYIHNNPVRKGLVTNALDWKWSSAKDWLTGDRGEIPIDKKLY